MDNREVLEQQLKDLEAQKVVLFDSGSADPVQVARLNAEIKTIQNQLDAIEVQDIADDYHTSDKPYIISVSGVEINLQDYIQNEDAYRFIAIALSQRDSERDAAVRDSNIDLTNRLEIERQQFRIQLANADAAADAKFNDLSERHETLNFEQAKLNAEVALLRTQNHDLRNERDDFERKLTAATSEIDSLKQQLEVANSRVEVKVPTNLDGNLAEAMRKANEAKRAIYDVVNDSANINYTAKFVDNDETFTDKVIYIGKYRQMSNEEAKRFQQEAEQAKQTELESTPEAEITPEPVEDQFRNDLPAPDLSDVDATNGLDENVTEREDGQDGEVGTVAETWEQWVESTLLNLVSTVNELTTDSVLSSAKPPVREAA